MAISVYKYFDPPAGLTAVVQAGGSLAPSTTYYVRVVAGNSATPHSQTGFSAPAETQFTTTGSDLSALISWTHALDNNPASGIQAANYRVYLTTIAPGGTDRWGPTNCMVVSTASNSTTVTSFAALGSGFLLPHQMMQLDSMVHAGNLPLNLGSIRVELTGTTTHSFTQIADAIIAAGFGSEIFWDGTVLVAFGWIHLYNTARLVDQQKRVVLMRGGIVWNDDSGAVLGTENPPGNGCELFLLGGPLNFVPSDNVTAYDTYVVQMNERGWFYTHTSAARIWALFGGVQSNNERQGYALRGRENRELCFLRNNPAGDLFFGYSRYTISGSYGPRPGFYRSTVRALSVFSYISLANAGPLSSLRLGEAHYWTTFETVGEQGFWDVASAGDHVAACYACRFFNYTTDTYHLRPSLAHQQANMTKRDQQFWAHLALTVIDEDGAPVEGATVTITTALGAPALTQALETNAEGFVVADQSVDLASPFTTDAQGELNRWLFWFLWDASALDYVDYAPFTVVISAAGFQTARFILSDEMLDQGGRDGVGLLLATTMLKDFPPASGGIVSLVNTANITAEVEA